MALLSNVAGVALLGAFGVPLALRLRSERAALQSAQAVYGSLALRLLEAGTWRIDLRQPARRVHLSPRAHALLGLGPQYDGHVLPLQAWRDAVQQGGDETAARAANDLRQEALDGKLARYDVVYPCRHGADAGAIWLRELAETLCDADGNPLALAGILVDVTAARRAESEVLHARLAADRARQARHDFVVHISREVRTPMNAVLGFAYLALKTALTPTQRTHLEKIQTGSRRLLEFVNDLIDIARIDSGELQLETADFAVDKLLEELIRQAGERAHAKGIEFIVQLNPAVPETLHGDAVHLRQILSHFVGKALQFTARGEVTLAVYPLEQDDSSVLLRFDVRDAGEGLTPEQIDALLQSHVALEAPGYSAAGSGLGFAICRKLAELMHGKVGIDSQAGQGSNFWFTARLQKTQAALRTLIPHPDLRGRKVLVVDDNEHARLVLQDLLNDMTFQVDAVANGSSACEALRAASADGAPYELVLLDWLMPDQDGIAVAKAIRALDLSPMPRMLMVTASSSQEVQEAAQQLGIAEVLIKPVTPSLLFDAALRALRGEQALRDPPPPDAVALATQRQLAGIAGARILLVEDNPLNQEVAFALLSDAGFHVEFVDNGQIALERLRDAPWDLVLMDLQMPVLDGLQTTRTLRKSFSAAELPVLALTANLGPSDLQRCYDAGMQGFVAKPIAPNALWTALLRWIPAERRPEARVQTPQPQASWLLHEALSQVEGLDLRLGLQRVRGKESIYLRLLRRFAESERHNMRKLQLALAQDDWAGARRLAHTTRASAGNIGASMLETQAEALEHALARAQRNASLDAALLAFEAALNALLAGLEGALPAEVPVPDGSISLESLQPVSSKLLRVLDDADALASDVFEQYAPLLRAAYPAQFHALERAVHNYDFETSAQLLRSAMAQNAANGDPAADAAPPSQRSE